MACGVPVVGSVLDGSREVLIHGKLGILMDPRDARSLERGIREALARPRGVPADLTHYEYSRFRARVHTIVDAITLSAIPPSG
jgi:glycosyltransferase involved in cell wall biosynthesis